MGDLRVTNQSADYGGLSCLILQNFLVRKSSEVSLRTYLKGVAGQTSMIGHNYLQCTSLVLITLGILWRHRPKYRAVEIE